MLDGCGELEGEEPYIEQQDSAIMSRDTGLTSATFGNCCKASRTTAGSLNAFLAQLLLCLAFAGEVLATVSS